MLRKNPGPEAKLGGCHMRGLYELKFEVRARGREYPQFPRGENHIGDRKFFLRCLHLHRRLLGHKLGGGARRRHLSHGNDHLLADPCAHPRTSRGQIPNSGVLNDCQIPLMGPKDPQLLGFQRVEYTPSLNKTFQVRLSNELLQQNPCFSYHYGRMSDIESMDVDTS